MTVWLLDKKLHSPPDFQDSSDGLSEMLQMSLVSLVSPVIKDEWRLTLREMRQCGWDLYAYHKHLKKRVQPHAHLCWSHIISHKSHTGAAVSANRWGHRDQYAGMPIKSSLSNPSFLPELYKSPAEACLVVFLWINAAAKSAFLHLLPEDAEPLLLSRVASLFWDSESAEH